jgi:hypothetical protein
MGDRIACYERKVINFLMLVQDLQALRNTLENFDENWKNEFQSNWINLDVLYAIALYRNIKLEDLDAEDEITKTLTVLKELIGSEIAKDVLWNIKLNPEIPFSDIELENILDELTYLLTLLGFDENKKINKFGLQVEERIDKFSSLRYGILSILSKMKLL